MDDAPVHDGFVEAARGFDHPAPLLGDGDERIAPLGLQGQFRGGETPLVVDIGGSGAAMSLILTADFG